MFDRWLTREEITRLFQAMRDKTGTFTIENVHAVRLLLLLAVRKEELIAAQWEAFDLDRAVWHLSEDRVKTSVSIDTPLPAVAVETLRELADWRVEVPTFSRQGRCKAGPD